LPEELRKCFYFKLCRVSLTGPLVLSGAPVSPSTGTIKHMLGPVGSGLARLHFGPDGWSKYMQPALIAKSATKTGDKQNSCQQAALLHHNPLDRRSTQRCSPHYTATEQNVSKTIDGYPYSEHATSLKTASIKHSKKVNKCKCTEINPLTPTVAIWVQLF